MTLNNYLNEEQISSSKFARQLDVCESTLNKLRYCEVIPRKPLMLKIYEITEKRVSPNDFYGITQ